MPMHVTVDVAVAAAAAYLFLVALKQGIKRRGEARTMWFVLALAVVPLLAAIHFMGRWDFSPGASWNRVENWWCLRVPPPEGQAKAGSFNVITGALAIALIFLSATALVGLF